MACKVYNHHFLRPLPRFQGRLRMIYGVSGMGFAEGTGEALKPISNQDVSSCESQSDIVSTAEKFDMGQENGGGVSCTMCFFFF